MEPRAQKFHDEQVKLMPLGPDGKTPQYAPWLCHMMNLIDSRAYDERCGCEWHPPYGWVVEAGCPQHD